MAALVTSRVADPVLEAEAHRQQAHFVLVPLPPPQLLQAVASSLGEGPRKTLTKSPISQELC
jgi:hypothetical protein